MINFSDLPQDLKDIFHSRASRLEGTTGEDLYSLIPDNLRDSASETQAYLQGNPALGIESRDVSHLISSNNGGSDQLSNLALERSSINQSHQDTNFTADRYDQMLEDNIVDSEIIDLHYIDDVAIVQSSEALLEPTTTEILGQSAGEMLSKSLLPVIGGAIVGTTVYKNMNGNAIQKAAVAATAGTGTASLLLITPFVREGFLLYTGYRIAKSTGLLSKANKFLKQQAQEFMIGWNSV